MSEAFSRLMRSLDGPVVIVTAARDGEPAGCLVGFCTQTSIDPERFLVCVSKKNHTHGVAEGAKELAVHVIPSDRLDLAERFGSETEDDPGSKFAGIEWEPGFEGVPLLRDCPSRFAGPVVQRHDLGDHTGFSIEPRDAGFQPGAILGFSAVKDLDPGHEP